MMKHFTIEELTRSAAAEQHGIANVPSEAAKACLTALVEHVLDPLREAWGQPIHVNSGYRCPALNAIVGGVKNSQHLLGQAADITTDNVVDNARLYQLIRELHLPVDQAINEYHFQWIHLSYGPRNRRQFFAIN